MTLIPHEDLARSHANYMQKQAEQAQPRPKTRADILIEIVRQDSTCTVAELAEAASRSPSWVRKHLREAGLTLTKPSRQKRQKAAQQ